MSDAARDLELVKEVYRNYAEGRIDAVFEALHPRFTFISCGPPDRMKTSGVWEGADGLRAYLGHLTQEWSIEEHEPLEFIQQGNRIVARTRVRTRSLTTDGCATLEKADFWTVEDGRILSFQEIFDTATALSTCPAPGL
ncbi:MAG: nuclear transport factor 2 family protein [Alphaproteobacteria bacterium]